MKQSISNNVTLKWIITVVLSVGVGTFISDIMENIDLNVWIARGTGALVTVIVTLILYHLFIQRSVK